MNASHPVGITVCQVVIDRDNVYTLSFQCVQIRRQDTGLGFTFTGLHLGDTALMDNDTTEDLNFIVLLVQNTACSFSGNGKCFAEDVVQGLAFRQAILKLLRLCAQLLIGFCHHLFPVPEDLIQKRAQRLDLALAVGSEDLLNQSHVYNSLFQAVSL